MLHGAGLPAPGRRLTGALLCVLRCLQGVLSREEAELLLAASHRPSFALAVLSHLAAAAPLRDAQHIRCAPPALLSAFCAAR